MKIHSIFQSVNGEVTNSFQGSICTFIRFQGCNLKCCWCDTPGSQPIDKGTETSVNGIMNQIHALPIKTKNITITGGEPLIQPMLEIQALVTSLYQEGFVVSVETNGTKNIGLIMGRCSTVMDIKPPSSGIVSYEHYHHKALLHASVLVSNDWVKFPIQNGEDFEMAVSSYRHLSDRPIHGRMAFSAVSPLTPKQLYEWLFAEKLENAVLNVQLHKVIGVA